MNSQATGSCCFTGPAHRATGRWTALLVWLLYLTACTTWQSATASPTEVIDGGPETIRITTISGEVSVVPNPVVRNDSIVSLGLRCGTDVVAVNGQMCGDRAIVAVPDVAVLEVRRVSRGRIIVGSLTFLAALVAAQEWKESIE